MKKLPVLFSLLLMAALLLAACGGANNNTNANNVGDTTPGVGDTTGTDVVPETGGDLDATPTLAVTDEVTTEPTATEAAGDATPVTGTDATPAAGTDATPAAGGDVAAGGECRPFQLTSYLDYEIAGADGENIGEVDGIVVFRDASLANNDGTADTAGGDAAAQNTPAATVDPAATPAAGDATQAPAGDAMAPDFTNFTPGQYANPQVAYFVVDFDDAAGYGDSETLIPFGAFTPLNEQTLVEDCMLVFSSSYELSDFPVWDWDARPDFTDENWDNEWRGFWSNLGVDVSTTAASGGQQLGNPVVFRDNFDDIDVLNLNGEDLGEIEDFIIDPATGEIRYAVLAAGGFLGIGEKNIPVPMNMVMWGNYDDDFEDLGEIYINHPDDGWDQAPEIDLDNVDFSVEDWDTDFNAYWESLDAGAGTTPAP